MIVPKATSVGQRQPTRHGLPPEHRCVPSPAPRHAAAPRPFLAGAPRFERRATSGAEHRDRERAPVPPAPPAASFPDTPGRSPRRGRSGLWP